jgi:hypothetical protein
MKIALPVAGAEDREAAIFEFMLHATKEGFCLWPMTEKSPAEQDARIRAFACGCRHG